jgi:hypothetical protein
MKIKTEFKGWHHRNPDWLERQRWQWMSVEH